MTTRLRALRAAAYALAFVVMVSAYPPLMRPLVRRDVTTQLTTGLAAAVAVTGGEVDSWAEVHRIQALTLARVARLELVAGAPAADSARTAARFGTLLDSLAGASHYTAAWVLGAHGAVLARTRGAGAAPAADGDIRVSRSPAGDVHVDFTGATPDGGWPRVVIRSRLDAESFTRLDPGANRSARTTRTTILMREGDSIHVVALASRTPPPVRAWPVARAPESLVQALGPHPARGLGTGSGGRPAFYATGSSRSLGLPIVREVDEAEVMTQFRAGLMLQGALIAGLLLALTYLVQSRWQAAQLRREREMMRVRDDFVSSVSHELRTPLTQIRMYAELLRAGSLRGEADTERALGVIEKEARRLAILVDNVLNFSRLKRRTQEVSDLVTDVAEETRQAIDAFAPLAAERGVRVVSEVPEELHARVDSLALRQLLLNLLENAAKYGPRGQRVVISAHAAGPLACIRVDDEGPGVPVAERARIWEPFHRGTAGSASEIPGSGIGLSVVQDLVIRHGGTVAVGDAVGGGARFEVCFPRAEPAISARASRRAG